MGGGEDGLGKPVAVAVDGDSRVFVADTERSEVVAFTHAGDVLQRFRPPDVSNYRPVAVAVRNGTLDVADIERHVVDVFSTADGQHISAIGGVGSEPGQFYFPMGVATGGNDQLFVSDMMNARVQVFGANHEFQQAISQPGDRYGDMGKPRQLAVAADGTIAVADSEFAHVHLFDGEGRLLILIGGPTEGPGATPMPVGVAIAPSLPESIASRVPAGFDTQFYLFASSSVGTNRISLFAIGEGKP